MDDKAIRAALLTAKGVKARPATGDTAAQNIADYVAEMLREGRANEITAELLAQADPQRLWKHYTAGNTGKDMPMDIASRMARAKEMRFDPNWYHGSDKDLNAFDARRTSRQEQMNSAGVHLARDPEFANRYAPDKGGVMYPLAARGNVTDGTKLVTEGSPEGDMVNQLFKGTGRKPYWSSLDGTPDGPRATAPLGVLLDNFSPSKAEKVLDGSGVDNVTYTAKYGVPSADGRGMTLLDQTEAMLARDPANLRSQFARFDPRLAHLDDLNAARGGRIGHADGGPAGMGDNGGPPLSEPPVDLGAAREQKQLRTFHKGLMSDVNDAVSDRMEAHQKAVDAGVFDGYEVGDTFKGKIAPMKITGRFVRPWKPNMQAAFDRMGAKPTLIEHEGKQYVPMLRTLTGNKDTDDWQEGDAYLDGVKAMGYPKMGGLRAVKADGGSVGDARAKFLAGNHPDVPDTVYHGNAPRIATKGWTSEIDPEQTQKNIEAQDFHTFKPSDWGNYGKGIYLTDRPDTASQYAMGIRADQTEAKPHGQVMKLHVSMKQPFTDETLRHPAWKDYIKQALTAHYLPHNEDRNARDAFLKKLDEGTATVRDMFLRDTPRGTIVNQFGQHDIHDTIRNSGFDGIIAHRPEGGKEIVAFKPEQVKSAIGNRGSFDPTNPDMTYADGGSVDDDGIEAYHGSPHDFDQFDISKIGTGEGAQAYGHGLYFAGREGIAKHYRDSLSDPDAPLGGFKLRDGSDMDILRAPDGVYSLLDERYRDTNYDKLMSAAQAKLQWAQSRKGPLRDVHSQKAQDVIDFLKANEGMRFERNPARGTMYKVKLNVGPHELLDWDAPVSEQHPNVMQKMEKFFPEGVPTMKKYNERVTGGDLYKMMVERAGGIMHRKLLDDAGTPTGLAGGTPERLSKYLYSQGIKGIRYRDAGSRGDTDGDPTHNYVMFHHDPVKVTDKYAYGGYVPKKTVKAYKLFRKKGDSLLPLFVNADKPVEQGKWLEAEEGPKGKAEGKVKSKLGDLAYRPGWHAGDLPIATHIGGKSSRDLKAPDYRPDDQVWAEVEMADDHDWQSAANQSPKRAITDQVPLRGHYRFKTNPNMTGNWLIGGHMKVNRVLSDEEVQQINGAAGTADLPRLKRADGGPAMFEGMHEDLQNDDGTPLDLWHGTPQPKEFEAFDDSKLGSERDHGFYGRGHYLTPDDGAAAEYTIDHSSDQEGTVMGPLHAALKNPYIWDTSSDNASHRTLRDLQSMGIMRGQGKLEPWDNLQRHHIDPFMREMQRRGHDGVLMKTNRGLQEVVVFNPNMIKHKDAEVFDPTDPRIRRNDGGRVNLFSKAAQIVRGLKDQPMQVDDIVKYALGKGAKPAEFKHANLPSGKATPSQVASDLEFFQPAIGVKVKGGQSFRYGSGNDYSREYDRLNAAGQWDQGERLMEGWEAFEGHGGGGAEQPQYARFQLGGKKNNYREHILTLDSHQGPTYTTPVHWSQTQNPLVHVRMSDRMDGNKKILHIEEIQSDWNNDARRAGIRTGNEQAAYDAYVAQMRKDAIDKVKARTGQDYYDPNTGEVAPTMSPMVARAQIEKYQNMDPYTLAMKMGRQEEHRNMFNATKRGVPAAPYINPKRDDAIELAMKHILMEAAKGGYDGVAFTPDEAQSERWKDTDFNGIYNKKIPSMTMKLAQQHDPETDDDRMNIDGWGAPVVNLSEKARDSINKNGFSSFRRGGYVTHVRRAR